MLFHNHPLGNLKPSGNDIAITKKITEAGHILEVKVLDHLTITNEDSYFSFADEGLM
jgi:DNA repair protein RadC